MENKKLWKLEKYKSYYYAYINNHSCSIFINEKGWFKPYARNTDHKFKSERSLREAKEAIYRVLKREALMTLNKIKQHRKSDLAEE